MDLEPSPNPAPDDASTLMARVVDDVMRRRAAGESVSDESVIAQHPELMPRLAQELARLALLSRARSRQPATTPATPETDISGYVLKREVHRGGQGVVYEATQLATGRRVAIKVRRSSIWSGKYDSERFRREVEVLARLDHPNIVRVIDSGTCGGHMYFAMDFVDGTPIDEFVHTHPMKPREILSLFAKVARAVNVAHLRGIVHRDLKPANILVEHSGEPRLLDFGLAMLDEEGESPTHTQTGQFVGSMPWASPEQAEGDLERIDHRTDVYSLGVVLYKLLTGKLPYPDQKGMAAMIRTIAETPPTPPSRHGPIDADIEVIILKCLHKEPKLRYESAGELADDVDRHLASMPILARSPTTMYVLRRFMGRNRTAVVAALLIALSLVLGLFASLDQLGRARRAEHQSEERLVESKHAAAIARRRQAQAELAAYQSSIFAADAAVRALDGAQAERRLAAAPEYLRDWEWQHLQSAADRSFGQMISARGPWNIATNPEGTEVVMIGDEGTVRVADALTGATRWHTRMPGRRFLPVAMSADGSTFACPLASHTYVFRTTSPRLIMDLPYPPATAAGAVALSADGSLLATYVLPNKQERIEVREVPSGRLRWSVPISYNTLGNSSIAWWPDASKLLHVDYPDVVLRDAEGSEVFRTPIYSMARRVDALLAVSPAGDLFATCAEESLRLFTADGTLRKVITLPGPGTCVTFSPDGRYLAAAAQDRVIRLWSLADLASEPRVLLGHTGAADRIEFLLGGRYILSHSPVDRTTRLWAVDAPPASFDLDALSTTIRSFEASFSKDGRWIYTVGTGGWAKASVADRSCQIHTIPTDGPDGKRISNGCFSPDCTRLVISVGDEVRMIDLATERRVWTRPIPNAFLTAKSFTADGSAVCFTAGGRVHWINAGDGSEATLPDHLPPAFSLGMNADNSLIAVADSAGNVTVFERPTWRERAKFKGVNQRVWYLTFSPDSTRLLTSTDAVFRLYDLSSGALIRRIHAECPLFRPSFNPSGTRLVATGKDYQLHLWDVATGEEMLRMPVRGRPLSSSLFSPDGRFILVCELLGGIRVWDSAAPRLPDVADR